MTIQILKTPGVLVGALWHAAGSIVEHTDTEGQAPEGLVHDGHAAPASMTDGGVRPIDGCLTDEYASAAPAPSGPRRTVAPDLSLPDTHHSPLQAHATQPQPDYSPGGGARLARRGQAALPYRDHG